jgi:hypothetical protein
MKNENIQSLRQIVPIETRLEVYKQAIKAIENNIVVSNMDSYGLCVLLPCLLWDLKLCTSVAPDGYDWDYEHTSIAFPELTSNRIQRIGMLMFSIQKQKDLRIHLLKLFVKKLEKRLVVSK